jgi:GLPGLI family protein
MQDKMVLQIGQNVSKFYSYNTFRYDSIIATGVSVSISSVIGNVTRVSPDPKYREYVKHGEHFRIYKNHPDGKTTFTDYLSDGYVYLYEEDIPIQEWTIQQDTATISGYKCQKATCTFRGRDYLAWFTNEIPINNGPYKFGGLPGLIVNIEDLKSYYTFLLTNIENTHDTILFEKKNYTKMSRADYTKIRRRFIKDPLGLVAEIMNIIEYDNKVKANWHYDVMERDHCWCVNY